ncbi:Protein serine/threonine phosphatase PrpC, regulation of stationary phase [Olavius sp. associated proteobacterium Delta 1]|nr:Protein serine/threonine phosphatase PrpC, regulation of stationary phase [Olavius sp. associated proteobacterium Delta 1]
MIAIESAGITDVGKKRRGNEDALFLDDTLGLYVVADGMGGHRAGEIASQLVVKTISRYILQSKNNGDAEKHIHPNNTLSHEANRLLSGIRLSNKVVHEASLDNEACRGMGSTVSAVYFTDGTFIVANVGDSPIYLIRDGKIKLISVLHTVMAEQAAINPANAQKLGREFRHVLTRAMGTDGSVNADIYEIQCFKDDILVISSDGLSDKASPDEILELVIQNGLDTACQKLVKLANDRGGDDNVTTIVLKVKMIKNSRLNFSRMKATTTRFFSKYFSNGKM